MSLRVLVAALTACALSACSASNGDGSAAAAQSSPTGAAVPTSEPTAPAPLATDTTPPVSVTLDARGLKFASPGNASVSLLAFGVPREMADAAVAAVLGPPNAQDSNDECSEGEMDFSTYGPLSLNFQNGKFVGWGVFPTGSDDAPGFATVGGVGIGMPRAALEKLHQLSFPKVSSIPEFSFGQIHGKFDSGTPPQTVAALWAGTNCIFR